MIARTEPSASVPTCPGWTADDLLWHLAEVQHFWGSIVDRGLRAPDAHVTPDRPASRDELLDLFDGAHTLLQAALDRSGDATPVWTWAAASQHVGFVRRRQAHEALIHRLDAEIAGGEVTTLDPELATDGVDEIVVVMYGAPPEWAELVPGGPVGTLRTTDTGRSWTVRVARWSGTSPATGTTYVDERALVADDPSAARFEVSATAGDLDAWCWNRPTSAEVTVDGDASELEAMIAVGLD